MTSPDGSPATMNTRNASSLSLADADAAAFDNGDASRVRQANLHSVAAAPSDLFRDSSPWRHIQGNRLSIRSLSPNHPPQFASYGILQRVNGCLIISTLQSNIMGSCMQTCTIAKLFKPRPLALDQFNNAHFVWT